MDTKNGARVSPTAVQQQAPRCKICRDLRVTADRRSCLTLDLAEVALSARSSCRSCCILMFAVKPYESRSTAKRNELHIGVFVRSLGVYGSILICCLLHRIPGPLGKNITTKTVALELSTSTACPYRSITRKGATSGNTGSDRAVSRIKDWLQVCSTKHAQCGRMSHLQAFDLPARLVEISPDVNHSDRLHVKLVAPMLKDIRYICLSHCWGHRTFIQTQKSNLSQFVEAIPWHELPRTFQEAISLTFRLGISYIWIDSLCICQDDTADWRHEGSRMDSIFTGAYLTLAASRSASAEEGLFVDSFANTSRMLQWNGGRAKWDVHVRESFAHETFDSSSMPLLHRAWVFQERLLSVRVVHFTSTELLWECTEETTCECTKLCQHVPPRRRKGGLKPEESLLGEQTYWHELVQEYTTKQLSYEKDIFPALQGVARRMRTFGDQGYYAGLWASSICRDLLWYTKDSRQTRRPQNWRAPSWSWASVIGEVAWPEVRGEWWNDRIATIVSVSTMPAGADAFGELSGGSLRIKGRCAHGALVYHTHEDDRGVHCSVVCLALGVAHEQNANTLVCELDYDIALPEQQFPPVKPARTSDQSTHRDLLLKYECAATCRHASNRRVRNFENILAMRVARDPLTHVDVFLALKCVDGSRQEYERFGIAMAYYNSRTDYHEHVDYFESESREITII